MADEPQLVLVDRMGRPVQIKRFPPKGSRGKFKPINLNSNSMSPFERFAKSNGNSNKITSY